MRLFIAIELPENVRADLARAQDQLRREIREAVSWVKESNLHLTVKFLGEVTDERLELIESLRMIPRIGVLSLKLDGISLMPPRGPARVIAADLAGDVEQLKQLAEAIDEVCHAAGFQKEHRAFRAHVTLGRLRPPRRVAEQVFERIKFTSSGFSIASFALMRSELNPKGSIYTRVAEFVLAQ
jgi:2'-5' RNA ligase